jgi:phosphoribosylanthranilate isomerase
MNKIDYSIQHDEYELGQNDQPDMLVKICGMKQAGNIRQVALLQPDFMGFIFYSKSPRYVEPFPVEILNSLPPGIKKTGVFVNEDIDDILKTVHKYNLDAVQLHGSDLEKVCRKLRETELIIIKAFPIATASNFIPTSHYEGLCDYFLFDTRTEHHGGSGVKFNWNLLYEYKGTTPFFLSGGIAPDDVNTISAINHPLLAGIDLNSRFEIKPGLKDADKLSEFLHALSVRRTNDNL